MPYYVKGKGVEMNLEKQEIIKILGYVPETIDSWSFSDLKEYLAYLRFINRGMN
jgi:hypothetical protein